MIQDIRFYCKVDGILKVGHFVAIDANRLESRLEGLLSYFMGKYKGDILLTKCALVDTGDTVEITQLKDVMISDALLERDTDLQILDDNLRQIRSMV